MDLEMAFGSLEDQLWLLHDNGYEDGYEGVLDVAHRYLIRMEFVYEDLRSGQRRRCLDSSE